MSPVEPKVAFDVLHAALVEYQQRFISSSLNGTGLILIVISWVVTNEKARAFLVARSRVRKVCAGAILLAVTAYLLLAIRMVQVIQHIGAQLNALNYLPRAIYEYRVLSPLSAAAVMALPLTPCLLAAAFFLFVRVEEPNVGEAPKSS